MKKPWDEGWIPPPKPIKKWEGPVTPEGWAREERTDWVGFSRPGGALWSYDRIVGRPGKKWRLYMNCSGGVFKAPDFTSSSLEALLVWYAIEKGNALQAPAGETFTVGILELGTLIHADLETFQEYRVCKL